MNMKNKWVAALLNILPGLGYLYLGVRTNFAAILLLLLPAAIFAGTLDPTLSSGPNTGFSWGTILILAVPMIAFMVDGYSEANRVNAAQSNHSSDALTASLAPVTGPFIIPESALPPITHGGHSYIASDAVGDPGATISVAPNKAFIFSRLVPVTLGVLFLAYEFTEGNAHLLTSLGAIGVNVLTMLLLWAFVLRVVFFSRYELNGPILRNTVSKKTVDLTRLASVTAKGQSLVFRDDQGHRVTIVLTGTFPKSQIALLLKKIRPYMLAPAARNDNVIQMVDTFIATNAVNLTPLGQAN
jgi:hypothetical protein